MFLLVPAHPGSPGQRAVKRLLLLLLNDRMVYSEDVILFLQKDEVYLNLVLEYVPETVYRVARNCSKSKQTMPPLLIKVIF